MKNITTTLALCALLALAPQTIAGQTVSAKKLAAMKQTGLNTISEQAAQAHVYFLADDALDGRRAGERGSQVAAQYIVAQMRLLDVQPLGDDYLQHFEAYAEDMHKRKPWYVEADSVARIKRDVHRRVAMANVLGVIPGERSNEYVVVGAHLDHEGTDPQLDGDKIYNGADDNASGVSAVLQIMRAFKKSGVKPERTIIFAFWDGEEMGLLGSRYFVENFADIQQVKGYLNFDMVGRNNRPDDPPYMVYFYTAAHPALGDWLKADVAQYGFNLKPDYRAWDMPVGGSDNGSFAKKNIPIAWYHTDGHPDYNHPTDEANRINYPKLAEITRAAYLTAWHMVFEPNY